MKKIFILLTLSTLFACNNRTQLEGTALSSKLISGDVTDQSDFRSTVMIVDNCTASKISSHHFLLAAHCLLTTRSKSIQVRKSVSIGRTIDIQTHYRPTHRAVTITNVFPHPSYRKIMKQRIQMNKSTNAIAFAAFDIGIIEVADETPAIPIADLSQTPVDLDESIVIGGYGCEYNTYTSQKTGRYKTKVTEVYSLEDVPYTYYYHDLTLVEHYNFLSKGKKLGAASICPGDSGGPVYRNSNRTEVVGVNSQYIFIDDSGISYVNLHTRIDQVYDWIIETIDEDANLDGIARINKNTTLDQAKEILSFGRTLISN